nr:hypothetical protein BaRGS_017862 [Batillaria attramentaria]
MRALVISVSWFRENMQQGAFSEPETENVRQWLTNMRNRAKLYLTLHAYGQYMLYPYGSDENRRREDEDLLTEMAAMMKCCYPAAGGSDDFAKGALGISLSYTPELSPDSYSGTSGFVLPSTEIASVVSDTWGGVKAMVRKVFDSCNGLKLS